MDADTVGRSQLSRRLNRSSGAFGHSGRDLAAVGSEVEESQTAYSKPRQAVHAQKKRRDWLKAQAQKHEDWWLLEEDESWFHRFIQPHAYAWSETSHPLKLIQQVFKRSTPDKAVACFGALCQESKQILMDFVQGYPNSEQMWWVIVRLLRQAKDLGKKVMVLIWDNAPWHCSKCIREWIRTYNQQAKQAGDVRLVVHWLPKRSLWLNPIEPYWGMPNDGYVSLRVTYLWLNFGDAYALNSRLLYLMIYSNILIRCDNCFN